jgi:transposase
MFTVIWSVTFSLRIQKKGFKLLLKSLPKQVLVVMEATGYYHYRLAQFLHHNIILVSVVNPLSVKRFIQMKLTKIKTNKSDARSIFTNQQHPF